VLFNNAPNDAIVSVDSQFNGMLLENGMEFFGDVHSHGIEALGFSPPSALDSINVGNAVLQRLNESITNYPTISS
jgi:hypothetical protein